MTRTIPMQVQCPVCQRPFGVQVEQMIDVGSDPTGKERLLSGQVNVAICPQCGNGGMLNAPLLYHDPAHDMLLAFVPMEMNLPQEQREQLIGGLTRNLMSQIPAEARKGYLFSPQVMLTMDGLVEQILRAEGIPAEVLEMQRKQSQLLSRLLAASEAEFPPLVKAHDGEIDERFFQMLAAAIDSVQRAGRQDEVQQLVQIRNRLLLLASWSRQRGITAEALDEQQARVDLIEQFLATEESQWDTLAREQDQRVDYGFFQLLTAMAEGIEGEMAAKLFRLRDLLMNLSSTGQAARSGLEAVDELKAAADAAGGLTREILLERILGADSDAEVEALAIAGSPALDYSFFILLADKIEAADNKEAVRLGSLREKLVAITEEWEKARAARVEQVNRQLEELLQAEDSEELVQRLLPEIDQVFLSILANRAEMAKRAGESETAVKVKRLLDQILTQIRASAPPEIQLINDLMGLEDKAAIRKALASRQKELTPAVLALMDEMYRNLHSDGRDALAEKMAMVRELGAEYASEKSRG